MPKLNTPAVIPVNAGLIYHTAAMHIAAVRNLLGTCPTSVELTDIDMDLDCIHGLLVDLATPLYVPKAPKQPESQPITASNKGVSVIEPKMETKEMKPDVIADAPPTVVMVGAFPVSTVIPTDDKLKLMGLPVLQAYCKHHGVEMKGGKAGMIEGLKTKRDTKPTTTPAKILKPISFEGWGKGVVQQYMSTQWTPRYMKVFCEAGGFVEPKDLPTFILQLKAAADKYGYEGERNLTTLEVDAPRTTGESFAEAVIEEGVYNNQPEKEPTPAPKTVAKPHPKPKAKAKAKSGAETEEEVMAAQRIGLSVVKYRILKALASTGKEHTYRAIEAKTGYYSILTAQMRPSHSESLCSLGLATEGTYEIDGKDKLAFTITQKGYDLLKKADA